MENNRILIVPERRVLTKYLGLSKTIYTVYVVYANRESIGEYPSVEEAQIVAGKVAIQMVAREYVISMIEYYSRDIIRNLIKAYGLPVEEALKMVDAVLRTWE